MIFYSCSQKQCEVTFSHAVQFDNTLKSYEFIIQNKSDSNLLIFVPNLYISGEGITGNEYILDAISKSSNGRYFEPLNALEFDQTKLASELLTKTDIRWKDDFKLFTNPYWHFPILLFLKSRSCVAYRYNCDKNLPKGKYKILYDTPDFIAKSIKMKEWKKELRRINKVADYFYVDINMPIDNGISFEVK
jgi:hypothetical protein